MAANSNGTHASPAIKPLGDKKPIRAAVVGVGRMGRHHARVYAQLPETQLVGVVDANPERAEALAEQHSSKPFYNVQSLIATTVVPRAWTEHPLRVGDDAGGL